MCSIVRIDGNMSDIRHERKELCGTPNSTGILEPLLIAKGGEQFGCKIKYKNQSWITSIEEINLSIFLVKVYEFLNDQESNESCTMIFHSRQAPEMEGSTILNQPYYNSKDESIVAVHGTIPNVHLLEKELGVKLPVDTDLFNFLPFKDAVEAVEKLGGKITAISIDDVYTNGLGLYSFKFEKLNIITNISDAHYDMNTYEFKNIKKLKSSLKIPNDKPNQIIVLSTGGLDITTSTLKFLSDTLEEENKTPERYEVRHWYFNWGSNAAKAEINTVQKLIEKYKEYNRFDEFTFDEIEVFEIDKMFKNLLNVAGINSTRIADPDAVGGGHNEAEEAISYVPYRNTMLLTIAAAIAEQRFPNSNVRFLIGANLSEGMIYLDNSTEWLASMNRVVKVGGQKTFNFGIAAPFATDTKTNMLKRANKILLDMYNQVGLDINKDTYSCYFPKEDGSACNTCGSCLLKNNAILNSGIKYV